MISLKRTVLTVVLVLHASALEGTAEELKCDVNSATYCYWQLAWKYGASHLIRRDDVKTEFLEQICVTEDELPKVPVCKQYYNGCVGEEKQKFYAQELGYTKLQEDVTDKETCKEVTSLKDCVSEDNPNCLVYFYMTPTVDNTANNFKAAKTLRSCLNDTLKNCVGCDKEYLRDYIDSIADALTYLYWDSQEPIPSTQTPPQSTLGKTTHDNASPTDVAPSSTAQPETTPTQSSPTITTEGPEPTKESTTTTKPEPTTTNAPSSAFTNVPGFSALGLVSLIALARSL